ncbi:MAG: YwaF family protein [Firmicutes bacterium]|nr:YwaF family protein [Bacillota bacterium]
MFYFDFINPYIIYFFFLFFAIFTIYSIFHHQDFFRKNQKVILFIVTLLLIWSQGMRYIGVAIRDGFDVTEDLPFYICRFSGFVLMLYALTGNKKLESFLFYWGATGLAGILYPNGAMSNIANLTETFYIDHFLLTVTPFYLVVYRGYRPSFKDVVYITGFMSVLLLAFIPINSVLHSDYFYLTRQSIVGEIFPGLPVIVFVLIHCTTAFIFFSIYYLLFSKKNYSLVKVIK